MTSKIKIGLKLDNFQVEFWLYSLIERLLNEDYIILEFIHVNSKKSFNIECKNTLLNNYVKWDQSFFYNSKNAFELKNLKELSEQFKISVIKDFKKTISKSINVLLDFTRQGISKEDLNISTNGTWALQFGCYNLEKKGLELFWEVYYKKATSDSMLISYSNKCAGGKIIYKSRSNTKILSFYENRNNNYFKTSTFILRKLKQMHLSNNGVIDNIKIGNKADNEEDRRLVYPNKKQMIIFHFKLFFREIKQLYRKQFYFQEWQIILKYKSKKSILSSPNERWYADPFPVKENESIFLFFEDFIKREHKGCISYVEIKNNKISEPVEVLKEKFHLSYPHIFKDNNEYYMIPETMEANSIRLYKAIDFPKKWEFKKTLISNVSAVDATTLFYKNKVWLFTNIAKDGASDWEELYLFYSDNIFGEWHSHPLNPIISDVTRARPGGKIFINDEGELIRPSQDCSKCYGYAINLNKINKISINEYEEVQVKKFLPTELGNYFGTHTFNKIDDFYFFDVKKWVKNKNYNLLKFVKNIVGIYHHKPIRNFLFYKIKHLFPSKLN